MTISGTLLGTALLPATPPFTTGNYSPPAALGTVSAAAPTIDCAHDGSVLVLGDRNFNNGTGLNAGAVLLVTTEDGVQTWSKLPVTGAIDSERVGSQVACSPDGSVVVATSESAATSLYVWNRQDDGSYLQVARVSIRDASALGETGPFYYPTGLALDDTGNVAVIGFVNRTVDTAGVAERCGGALVCMKIDGTWQLSQALTLERVAGRAYEGQFGNSPCFSQDGTLVISAWQDVDIDSPAKTAQRGRVHVFTRSGNTYTRTHRLATANQPVYSNYGDGGHRRTALMPSGRMVVSDSQSNLVSVPDRLDGIVHVKPAITTTSGAMLQPNPVVSGGRFTLTSFARDTETLFTAVTNNLRRIIEFKQSNGVYSQGRSFLPPSGTNYAYTAVTRDARFLFITAYTSGTNAGWYLRVEAL